MIYAMVLSESWWSCHGCLDEERSALLRIKSSFNYPSGTFLPSWGKVADCCSWEQVHCNFTTGRVVDLYLSIIREEGLGDMYLNVSLFRPFQELQSLDLSANFIVGCVENEGLSLVYFNRKKERIDSIFFKLLIEMPMQVLKDYQDLTAWRFSI
ncbi:hypothetical protein NC652_015850 [Populus alba x Populus x berolinensis]|nr:hypothetical protein NC652_015850 [Populus alba x Populus x berolinensis]